MSVTSSRDPSSWGVIAYATSLFFGYQALTQLSLVERYPKLWCLAYALIVIHVLGWLWCIVVCLVSLKLRQLASFVSAALLVISLQLFSPNPLRVHLWLHKGEYLARVAAAPRAADGRLSIVLLSYGAYIPSMPGGYLCSSEIVYDNSNDLDLISRSADGRASIERIDENLYLRFPPCG